MKIFKIALIGSLFIAVLLYLTPWPPTNQDQAENHFFSVDHAIIPQFKSEVPGRDDANSRFDYMVNLQVDPATGQIPFGIYQRERAFVSDIPVRSTGNASNLRRNQEDWNTLGPLNVGGRTRAFGIDVRDNNIIVAGSVSGSMWRSEDAGATWSATSNLTDLVGATALVQDTRSGHEDTWYYGTGEIRGNSQRAPGAPYRGDGIFKSTDGARSWSALPATQVPVRNLFNSSFNYVYEILVNNQKMDIDEVYTAVYGAILRSQDGGDSWSVVLGDDLTNLEPDVDLNGADSPFFTSIEQSDSGVFYAYLSEATSSGFDLDNRGVFRSVDGDDWQAITPVDLPDSANRAVMAIAPTNEDVLYLFVHHGLRENESKAEQSLWRYEHSDPVGTWENLSENIPRYGGEVGDMDTQNSYNMVIEVHPNDEDIVFVGGTNLYRSLDGFRSTETTEWIGGYDTLNDASQYPNHHADQHHLFFLKQSPFRLYSTHDGGLSYTDISTIPYPTWTSLNNGYITTQFFTIDIQMDESTDLMLGGTQDNGSWFGTVNTASPWLQSLGGDGAFSAISRQAQFLYASAQRGRVFRIIPDFREQRLVSFSRMDPAGAGEKPGQEYLFINPFILDPNNTNRMFIAGGDVIWRNQNLTQIPAGTREKQTIGWDKLEATALADTGQISALAASVDIPNRLYYGTTTGLLFRIDSVHMGQGQVSEITGDEFPEGNIICIAIDPEDADDLVVAFSNYNVISIFRSTDGGLSFQNISGNLEEFEDGTGNGPSVRWISIVPLADGTDRYYAGTSTGLYSTGLLNGTATVWEREGANSIALAIVSMIKYRPLDGRMVVSTHGNGVFSSQIDGFKSITPPGSDPAPLDIQVAYPNPFNQSVTVEYTLPEEDIVLARIFDVNGKWITTSLWGTQLAGKHLLVWDGRNHLGQPAPDGIYLLNIQYQGKLATERLILDR